MINDTVQVFPNNAVTLIANTARALDTNLFVVRRPLKPDDSTQSVGVFGTQWNPNEDSYEMMGPPSSRHDPTLSSYLITVQAFVKDMDEERGLMVHGVLAKVIRSMLVRNNTLGVGLRSLSVLMDGSTERTKRFGVRRQNFVSNELSGTWLYLSTSEFWLETETS